MNILILGAGGFIGSNLVEHLLRHSTHSLVAIDADDEKLREVPDPKGQLNFLKLDIRESHDVIEELMRSVDLVVDLIAYANPSDYITRPLEVIDLNLLQNLELVDACVRHQKRLIQFSTCEVYGLSQGRQTPFDEDTTNLVMGPIKNQRWVYASAKELLERVIYAFGQEDDLDFTILRPFNFVGPKIDYMVEAGAMGGPRVFSHFFSALVSGGPLRLVDGGRAHRSFTHIDDACQAIRLVIDHPLACHNGIFNIGNPDNGTTIRDLAYLMHSLYGELTGRTPTSAIEEIDGQTFYGAGYEDCDWRIPDIGKISALGWQPQTNLRETFRRTMAWHLDRLSADQPLPSFLQAAGREAIAGVARQH
jgi:UDP-apiose/xylose synthase